MKDYIFVNGKKVILDLPMSKKDKDFIKGHIVRNKDRKLRAFKTEKVLDGNPHFKGYKVNPWF